MKAGFVPRPNRIVRETVETCTGENGVFFEDTKDWCLGWLPKTNSSDMNCTEAEEFNYNAAETDAGVSYPTTAQVNTYGGGGYILKLRGYIDDLKAKIVRMKTENWVDNRTRSLSVEFSVYNAQVRISVNDRLNQSTCSRDRLMGKKVEVLKLRNWHVLKFVRVFF